MSSQILLRLFVSNSDLIESKLIKVLFHSHQVSRGGNLINTAKIFSQENDINKNGFIGRFDVNMNTGLRVYKRTFGKLDNLLSYVGGLFEILIGFLAFFLSSFN